MCEFSGLSIGEIIDRMALNWSAGDPDHPIQLILDDTHTSLGSENFNITVAAILTVIKMSLAKDKPDAIRKVIDEIERILKDKMVDTNLYAAMRVRET